MPCDGRIGTGVYRVPGPVGSRFWPGRVARVRIRWHPFFLFQTFRSKP